MPDTVKEEFKLLLQVFLPFFIILLIALIFQMIFGEVPPLIPFILIGVGLSVLSFSIFGKKIVIFSSFFTLSSLCSLLIFFL
ncbi:hypothetical protein AZF04_14955 [Alkalihalobacillus trypoxylicola]|uniref:Uncharacterized protein n=1 Tax=Alkalihalobacillus trypoxylicola TaxID=519424 RepID=A0A162EZR6_9BACI|nr:hypothetical protein AZF04_14955 [Alkalihalobacillus trypoxylicola]